MGKMKIKYFVSRVYDHFRYLTGKMCFYILAPDSYDNMIMNEFLM